MSSLYNRFAGKNLDRLTALSDGVFAFAMTLLVLDLRPPSLGTVPTETGLLGALHAILPNFATYLMSFLTLGIFWIGQQTQLNSFERSDRDLSWIHIMFLLGIATLPFSTALLAKYSMLRTALLIYWLNILYLGVVLFISWSYVSANNLWKADFPVAMRNAQRHRIVVAQALYAAGAAFCVWNTYVSIAAIFFLQAFYAIAPRIGRWTEKLP
jgi:uncharacterized membrane protein